MILGSGVLLSKVANVACQNELSGLEFAGGIPGTIGGAVRMNAGAHRQEMKDIVKTVTYIDVETLKVEEIDNKNCNFSYRSSVFCKMKDRIIISTKLKLQKEEEEKIKQKMEGYRQVRREKQPLNYPNAGSIFKRGDSFITAELIDKSGLKGYNIGDAFVSDLHSGFIVNKGNAKAKDVLELIEYIKEKVYEKFNVNIELEIEILGED